MAKTPDENLDPRLQSLLNEIKPVPPRDPKRAARGRARFLTQAAEIRQQAVSRSPYLRLREWLDNIRRKENFAMTTLISVITILGLLLGGTGTVYASQDSLPTDVLYPVKVLTEEVRLELAADPQAEMNLLLGYAQRRVDEIAALVEEGVIPPDATMTRLNLQLQQALQLASQMDDAAMTQALLQNQTRLHIMLQNQLQRMENIPASGEAELALEQVRIRLEEQLRLVENGLADPQGFEQTMREEAQHRAEGTPPMFEAPMTGETMTPMQGGNGQGHGPFGGMTGTPEPGMGTPQHTPGSGPGGGMPGGGYDQNHP
ncbi:MAG: hypothetical protein GXP40_07745 [Chloroflexi bacterium]|nr:hypothetical protein [Chloroflexota bacterium]